MPRSSGSTAARISATRRSRAHNAVAIVWRLGGIVRDLGAQPVGEQTAGGAQDGVGRARVPLLGALDRISASGDEFKHGFSAFC